MSKLRKMIQVTHVNIRLSISFLLMKLIAIELVAGMIIISWQIGTAFYVSNFAILKSIFVIAVPVITLLVLLKTFITIFIILQWLNEYYEISSDMIKYRRGIIFRRVDDYPIEDIKFIDVEQRAFGRILNYGTITLLNLRRLQLAQM